MQQFLKYRAKDFPFVGELGKKDPVRAALILASFRASGGYWWRDKRGYHARASSTNKGVLLTLQEVLAGKISYVPVKGQKRGYSRWGVDKKEAVEWLDRYMRLLFLPAPGPQTRSVCRHCGGEDGYHEQECPDAPGE